MPDSHTSTRELLAYARRVIERAVGGLETRALPQPDGFDRRAHGGVFVTLFLHRRLRGCIGSLDSAIPLPEALRNAATDAGLHDPRFAPLTRPEVENVRISISILSMPEKTDDPLSLELGRHGILIRRDARRGLFLPQVAVEHQLDRATFLSRCCTEKAQLPADAWREPATEVLLFTTEVVSEED